MPKWRIVPAMVVAAGAAMAAGPPDHSNGLVYDPLRRQVVLITASDKSQKEELRSWDGRQWGAIPSAGPPARGVAATVYDTRQKSIVLFGGMGFDHQHKGDTWQFDGKAWREMPDTSAGLRDHHAMAFDEARGVAVMYGGGTKPGTAPTISEVSEWNGDRWIRIPSQGPGPMDRGPDAGHREADGAHDGVRRGAREGGAIWAASPARLRRRGTKALPGNGMAGIGRRSGRRYRRRGTGWRSVRWSVRSSPR